MSSYPSRGSSSHLPRRHRPSKETAPVCSTARASNSQVHSPTAGTMVVDTADAGDVVGWSWLVPPYRWLFDARAVEPTGAVSFDGRCLRGKCDQDPHLGYELMKLVTQVMFSRLTAARVRLLDLYGNAGTTSALLSPLLMEARPADAGTTDAGAT